MIFQLSMYYMSFMPLWISVIIMDVKSLWYDRTPNPWTEGISIGCIFICSILFFLVMKRGLKAGNVQNKNQVELIEAKEEKFLIAEFLMAYIFPLFAFDFTKWDGVVLFLLFFGIFGWQCIIHKYLCVNIVLDIMKYKVYDCKLSDTDVIFEKKILSKRKLCSQTNTSIVYTAINNDYIIDITRGGK